MKGEGEESSAELNEERKRRRTLVIAFGYYKEKPPLPLKVETSSPPLLLLQNTNYTGSNITLCI